MNDWPARIDPVEATIGRPTVTARRLVEGLRQPEHPTGLRQCTPAARRLARRTRAFRAKLAGQPAPAGERTARVLAGYRRTAGDRGRGQVRPFGVSDLAAVLATCHRPRRCGRGVESEEVALERGRLDAVIAGLLFMAGMRRSEVSALRWADVTNSTDGDGMLVTVRRSKTNQEGRGKTTCGS